jgi:hypothetical protein
MTRIVTYTHRPKRTPRKQPKAAAITGPTIVAPRVNGTETRRQDVADDDTKASPEAGDQGTDDAAPGSS